MADSQVGIQLNVKGAKETEDALKKVGNAAKGFETNTNTLSQTLTKLGVVTAVLYGAKKAFDFFVSTTKDILDEAKILQLLNATISSVGLSFEEARPKVDAFAKSMRELGVDDDQTYTSVTKLLKRTGDLDKAMEISKLASDLASSGINNYATNTDLLNRVLMGVGSRALIQFGVNMKENMTIAEQLSAVQKKVTQTTEQWGKTAEGQIATASIAWKEIREDMGVMGAITLVNLSKAFTTVYKKIGGDTMTFGKFMAEFWNIGLPTIFTQSMETITGALANFYQGVANILGTDSKFGKKYAEAGQSMTDLSNKYKQETINIVNNFDYMYEDLKGNLSKGAGLFLPPEEEIDKEAKKIEDTFSSLAKTITSKMQSSIDKITGLRNEIKKLGEDTEDQVNKQEELHKKDLSNLARSTQEKINEIDTQIADIKSRREQGWRTEVAKLESEKQKELSILDRIGNEGIAIQEETQKDALILLEEANAERIKEIRDNAEKERLEKEKEILEEQVSMTQGAVNVLKPGGLEALTKLEMNTPAWGTSVGNSIFNINIEGTVTSEGELLKKIQEVLNRASSLKFYGGTQ